MAETTRIEKYRRYRKRIMKMDDFQEEPEILLEDLNQDESSIDPLISRHTTTMSREQIIQETKKISKKEQLSVTQQEQLAKRKLIIKLVVSVMSIVFLIFVLWVIFF